MQRQRFAYRLTPRWLVEAQARLTWGEPRITPAQGEDTPVLRVRGDPTIPEMREASQRHSVGLGYPAYTCLAGEAHAVSKVPWTLRMV